MKAIPRTSRTRAVRAYLGPGVILRDTRAVLALSLHVPPPATALASGTSSDLLHANKMEMQSRFCAFLVRTVGTGCRDLQHGTVLLGYSMTQPS